MSRKGKKGNWGLNRALLEVAGNQMAKGENWGTLAGRADATRTRGGRKEKQSYVRVTPSIKGGGECAE